MLDRLKLTDIISNALITHKALSNNLHTGEELILDTVDKIFEVTPCLGAYAYVIQRPRKWDPYEIIPCTITSMRLSSKGQKTFSVEGYYLSTNRYYQANFSLSSLGKNIFLKKEDALKKCDKFNEQE